MERHTDFLRQIIDINPNFIFVKDREGRFTLVNRALADAYGTTVDGLIGKTDADFNENPEEVEWFRRDDLEVMDSLKEKLIPEEVITDATGRTRYLQTIKRPLLDASGKARWVLGVATDVTALKQAEEKRRALEAQMQHAQKLESLGILAGGIAHDFNNLLVGVMANADVLRARLEEDPAGSESLEHIRVAARRAADLCNQMLAYSGRGRFVLGSVCLNDVIRELSELLDASISKKAMVEYALDAELPALDADITQIRQIVMNLIVNASEALEEKIGTIRVATSAVMCGKDEMDTFTGERVEPGLFAALEVTDTGTGLDPAEIRRIVEPFYTSKSTGRGLGLAAVQGIVRGHRGAIQVESTRGSGTCFRVLLPVSVERDAQATPPPAVGHGDRPLPERVLVVDDEPVVLAAIQTVLELQGVHVLTAADGERALEILRSEEELSGVLLDLTMPRKGGEEVLREMRRLSPGLPVVIMSGYDRNDLMAKLGGSAPTDFLKKPFESAALIAAVRKLGTST